MHLQKFQKLYNSNYPYGKLVKRYGKMSSKQKDVLWKEAEAAQDKDILDMLKILDHKEESLIDVALEQEPEKENVMVVPTNVAPRTEKTNEMTK